MVRKRKIRLIWNTDALASFKEALTYIKSESPQGAEIVKLTVLNSLQLIKANPKVFPKDQLKDYNDGSYRAYSIYSYRITYKINETQIQILRFRHSSREPFDY
jgi:plasmid stabilization system protein ParE